jgi:hypothetical protein
MVAAAGSARAAEPTTLAAPAILSLPPDDFAFALADVAADDRMPGGYVPGDDPFGQDPLGWNPFDALPRVTLPFDPATAPAIAAPLVGPPDLAGYGPDEGMGADGAAPARSYRGFGRQLGAIKWEIGAVAAYYTIANSRKLFENPIAPHTQKEGFFGRSTRNVGVDKLAHAYSAYVVSELFHARLKHKTDGAPGIEYTAGALGFATTLYTELWDSVERSGGWSWEDVAMNSAGAGFSILRNSVPGLDRKLDYRLMVVPNDKIFSIEGKAHFEQQRYFFALKLSGFDAFERSPLRYLELHLGYFGKDFSNEDRAAGIRPQRRVFVGFGINLRELLFPDPSSRAGRAAGEVLDYFQPPYTALQVPLTR